MLLMMIMSTLTMLFMCSSHPLMLGIIIIIQTMMVAINTGMMMKSFWFSYILMIIMLSGMLVLFIYMASIASNEKFSMSTKMMIIPLILTPMMLIPKNEMMNKNMKIYDINLTLNKLFNSSMMITMMMIMYLLLTMIVVSKTVNINKGPLRTN